MHKNERMSNMVKTRNVGAQTQKKLRPPLEGRGGRRVKPGGVEARRRRAQHFAFFSLSLPHFRSFSFSVGLLVEFWWCLKRRNPQMCTSGVLGLSSRFFFSFAPALSVSWVFLVEFWGGSYPSPPPQDMGLPPPPYLPSPSPAGVRFFWFCQFFFIFFFFLFLFVFFLGFEFGRGLPPPSAASSSLKRYMCFRGHRGWKWSFRMEDLRSGSPEADRGHRRGHFQGFRRPAPRNTGREGEEGSERGS